MIDRTGDTSIRSYKDLFKPLAKTCQVNLLNAKEKQQKFLERREHFGSLGGRPKLQSVNNSNCHISRKKSQYESVPLFFFSILAIGGKSAIRNSLLSKPAI